jgi:hypothetical protein
LVRSLSGAQIAHGDLQHGNIIVNGAKLYLIDYDGLYVPGLPISNSNEIGHINYQHPDRSIQHVGPAVDRFSAIVIYIALIAVARQPSLWAKYDNSENLLFTRDDFLDPHSSSLIRELSKIRDIQKLVSAFQQVCSADFQAVPSLEDLIAGNISVHAFAPSKLTRTIQSQYPVVGADSGDVTKFIGQRIEVVGRIDQTFLKPAMYMFLNAGGRYPSQKFTIVVWPRLLQELASAGISTSGLTGQWFSVTGVVTIYKGTPQIQLDTVAQIKILGSQSEAVAKLQKASLPPAVPRSQPINPRPRGDVISASDARTLDKLYGKTLPDWLKAPIAPKTPAQGSGTKTQRTSTPKPAVTSRPITRQPASTTNATPNFGGCLMILVAAGLLGGATLMFIHHGTNGGSATQDVPPPVQSLSQAPPSPEGAPAVNIPTPEITLLQMCLKPSEDGECADIPGTALLQSHVESHSLNFLIHYINATPGVTQFQMQLFKNGELLVVGESHVFPSEKGVQRVTSPQLPLDPMDKIPTGEYEAKIFVNGTVIPGSLLFSVQSDPLSSNTETSQEYSTAGEGGPEQRTLTAPFKPSTNHGVDSNRDQPASENSSATNEHIQLYWGAHKHAVGSCAGQLQFSADLFVFLGAEHSLRLNKSNVAALNGNGIKDINGKNWHFKVEGKSDAEVGQLFREWLQR